MENWKHLAIGSLRWEMKVNFTGKEKSGFGTGTWIRAVSN